MIKTFKYIAACILASSIAFHALPVRAQGGLMQNANSAVLDSQTDIVCKSPSQAIQKESRTILVLNSKGAEAAHFFCGCDMFNSLQKFSGEIVDANGRTIRKIKRSELQKSEYSSHLSSDFYYFFYECNVPSYPFTVKYEWETKCNNGLISYQSFFPQTMFYQAVMKAGYRIELPAGETGRYHALNAGIPIQIEQEKGPDGQVILKASVSELTALVPEPFGPSGAEVFPRVYFSPNQFEYGNTKGSTSTWQEYGTWQYGLLNGRDLLDEPFKKKLHEMVAPCTTDREKVKVIYDYLAATTRYVSIQLGIGGLQPIPASNVCRTGFGDCKGLSNYMLSMLKEIGIYSRYAIINTNVKRILPDFASANQMNHAILQVPLPQDTLWLECTNAQLPFGYVHSQIAGHDAVLITEKGGLFCQLPTYPDSLNTQCITASVSLSEAGGAQIQVNETARLFQYENCAGIIQQEPNKQKERMRNGINLTQADINNLRINEKKESQPSIDIQYAIGTEQYGHKTGNRLFIPINIFRKGFNVPASAQRVHDIHINYGYLDTDSICLKIPEGYTIEGLPKPLESKTPFGSFHSSIDVQGRDIYIVHRLLMRQGIYPPSAYEEFIKFHKQIATQYSGRIILKKG